MCDRGYPRGTKTTRIFRGDKWNKAIGSRIPDGSIVEVLKLFPRRRVLVRWEGQRMNTMLWCLVKP